MGLPAGEDPDSLVANRGADGFRTLLNGARQLVDVIWQSELSAGRFDTPERRADLERRINVRLARIADESVKYHYQQALRDRLRDLFYQARRSQFGGRGSNRSDFRTETGGFKPRIARARRYRGDQNAAGAHIGRDIGQPS